MISVLVVEDEFAIAMDIEQRLIKMGYSVAGLASNYDEAIDILSEKTDIDIVLLDINLNKEKSGIDVGMYIKDNYEIPIIFLTAYSDSKTFSKAERANPMGYIIKPFKDADVDHNIKIALKRFKELKKATSGSAVVKNSDYLFVKDKGTITKIDTKSILWLEAMDNYTIIYHKLGRQVVNLYLRDLLEKLDANIFVRIHKSYAVSINNITCIEDNTVYIQDKFLTISRKYKKDFFSKINLV
jgi:DNA-binding LytR/AlgR family response regulator